MADHPLITCPASTRILFKPCLGAVLAKRKRKLNLKVMESNLDEALDELLRIREILRTGKVTTRMAYKLSCATHIITSILCGTRGE